MTDEDRKLAEVTKLLRDADTTSRREELVKQRLLLHSVPVLSPEDTIRVLNLDAPALILIDPDAATVKIPAFQFLDEDGQIKRVNGFPIISSGVLAIFQRLCPGIDRLSKLNTASAWHAMYWWVAEMRLDVRDPESRPFRPIDVVCNPQMLADLVDWFKDDDGPNG